MSEKEYEPYKYGLMEMQYMPTICQECRRTLTHTYTVKDAYQPELMFHVICTHCFIKYKRLSPHWK